jgi:DNA-binding NarL/FixJ family response regulator
MEPLYKPGSVGETIWFRKSKPFLLSFQADRRRHAASVSRNQRHFPLDLKPRFETRRSVSRPELSKRETEVLQCLAHGRSNKEIGQELSVREGLVKHHVKSILSKLDAIGRAEG